MDLGHWRRHSIHATMPFMSTLPASARTVPIVRPRARGGTLVVAVLPLATAIMLLGAALLVTLTPWSTHLLLAASPDDSLATAASRQALSDATIHDLVLWGDFSLPGAGTSGEAFYTPQEISHLMDARSLLYVVLAIAAVSAILVAAMMLRRREIGPDAWRAIGRGGAGLAIGAVIVGMVGLLAFQPAFELFHRIFFPGGNWSFDPATSNLVRLYPSGFWIAATAMLGGLAIGLGLFTAWLARARSRMLAGGTEHK